MAKKYPDFPSITERRQIMEELTAAENNGNALAANEHYRNYIEKLKSLNELMDKYSEIEEEYGIPATLDANGKDELMQAMMETAQAGETFLAAAENQNANPNAGVPGMVTRMQRMLSQDYDMLNNYDVGVKSPLFL